MSKKIIPEISIIPDMNIISEDDVTGHGLDLDVNDIESDQDTEGHGIEIDINTERVEDTDTAG